MSDLLLPFGGWNVQNITDSFSPLEADLILAISLPRNPSLDILCWHYDKKGVYSVKSGYKLVVTCSSSYSASASRS